MMTVRVKARRKWGRWIALLALLSLPTYLFLAEEYYYRVEKIDMTYWKVNGGFSDAELERIWNDVPLTLANIESYLRDATLVGQSRLISKAVLAIYAGTNHDYVAWEEGQPTSDSGRWATRWILEHYVWGDRSKWEIAQVFCFDVTGHDDLGYCIVAESYNQIFSFYKQPRRIPGNPLDIRAGERTPTDLAARVDRLGLIDTLERNH